MVKFKSGLFLSLFPPLIPQQRKAHIWSINLVSLDGGSGGGGEGDPTLIWADYRHLEGEKRIGEEK